MNRREFALGSTSAALGGSALALLSRPAYCSNTPHEVRPRYFIYDSRLATAADFQPCKHLQGIFVNRFDGDFSPAWYDLIAKISRDGQGDIVGITRHSELFIVETLSREHGYGVTQCHNHPDHCVWRLAPGSAKIKKNFIAELEPATR
ncbi:MAG: hypothetical protein ACU84Q_03615 [Gammaproteobacteria bacterium]